VKLRLLIYGSLLFVTLALPVAYHVIDNNLQKQEIALREQKENWIYGMIIVEWELADKVTRAETFLCHYRKGCEYFSLWLGMKAEDIDNLK
jgi:hypothetical protein